jgi:hypothetical protein
MYIECSDCRARVGEDVDREAGREEERHHAEHQRHAVLEDLLLRESPVCRLQPRLRNIMMISTTGRM